MPHSRLSRLRPPYSHSNRAPDQSRVSKYFPVTRNRRIAMKRDKQLHGISQKAVIKKRSLNQALNAKEFAVLVGICYSTARAWFRQPGFPVFNGVVFWEDFVVWRTQLLGLKSSPGLSDSFTKEIQSLSIQSSNTFVGRAAEILAEAH